MARRKAAGKSRTSVPGGEGKSPKMGMRMTPKYAQVEPPKMGMRMTPKYAHKKRAPSAAVRGAAAGVARKKRKK